MEHVVSISEKVKSFSLLCAAMVVGIHVADQQPEGTAMWWWSRIGHYGVFLIAVPFFLRRVAIFWQNIAMRPGGGAENAVRESVPYWCHIWFGVQQLLCCPLE